MSSVIRGSDGFDSVYGAALKAWVNFNGTGTVAIRASLGVSSITDNGVGDYTVNFTTAMPDENYAVVKGGGIADSVGVGYESNSWSHTISSCRIGTPNATTTADRLFVHIVIFR